MFLKIVSLLKNKRRKIAVVVFNDLILDNFFKSKDIN